MALPTQPEPRAPDDPTEGEGGAGADAGRRAGRRKGGRPRSRPNEGCTVSLQTLVPEGEAVRVRAEAEAAGLSVSAYVRRRLTGRPVASRVLARSVDAAQTELVRVGTNLNQLVRRANEAGALSAPEGAAVLAAMAAEVRAELARVGSAVAALERAAGGAPDSGEGPAE